VLESDGVQHGTQPAHCCDGRHDRWRSKHCH